MPERAKRAPRHSTARKQTDASAGRIEVRTPNVAGYSFTVAAEPYHAMKAGLLRVLPARAPGLTQAEMWAQVAKQVPRTLFPDAGKVAWWAKCVQLDLEAKGELEREATKPLRWHRRK